MGEEIGLPVTDATQPFHRPTDASFEALEFPHCPSAQPLIQISEYLTKCRAVETAIVVDPSSNDGIDHSGKVFKVAVDSPVEFQLAYGLSHGFGGPVAYRGEKADEELSLSALPPSRSERKPEEVELLDGVVPCSVAILAVELWSSPG